MANNVQESNTKDTQHRDTYEGFMSVTKWGLIFVVTVLALMAIFLA